MVVSFLDGTGTVAQRNGDGVVTVKFQEKITPYPRYFFYFPTVNMFVLVQPMHILSKAIHVT
jgi:hypothetical protein